MANTPATSPPPLSPPPARAPHKHESVSYTGHTKLLFMWPVILIGYLFWLIPINKEVAGWIFIWTIVICTLAVCVDLSRNHAFFWLAVAIAITFLGFWLRDAKHITLFGDIYRWFANRNVTYDPGMGLSISIILSIAWIGSFAWSYMNNRYTMTHNEVVHHVWGRGDTSIGRGARVITIQYPDFFEWLLCLAGTIIINDNTGRTVIARTEHVPLLPFKSGKIDKLLESVEVTADDQAAAVADAGHAESNADDWH